MRNEPTAVPDSLPPPYTPRPRGPVGLAQAYTFRNFAARTADELQKCQPADFKERTALASALRDLFAVWDGARQAIRIYKGIGNPKPVEARNARRNSKSVSSMPAPPPALRNAA